MLKKTLLISSLSLVLTNICYANNFYAGIGAGYQSADFDKKLTLTSNDGSYDYYKRDDLTGSGYFSNIFGGYAWNFNHFYLAAELNANLSSLKYHGFFTETENGVNNTSVGDFKMNNSYGFSVLPGYQISNNVLLYGRVGYAIGNFKYSEYKTNSEIEEGVTERQWLNGIRYGLGINTELNQNAGLRFEFNQTRYDTFKNTSFPMSAGRYRDMNLTPFVNQIELDFIYKFA